MFKAYWQNKSSREKKIIALIVTALTVILLFGGIWLPVHNKKNDLKDQLVEKQQLLALMNKQVPMLKALRTTQSKVTTKDIFSLVENQFKAISVIDPKLTIEKVADNKVKIQFNEIPFDDLIKQLVLLNKDFHITVDEFEAMKLEKIGMISGKVVLSL